MAVSGARACVASDRGVSAASFLLRANDSANDASEPGSTARISDGGVGDRRIDRLSGGVEDGRAGISMVQPVAVPAVVARIVTVDVWNFDALGRIVSFLGLIVALLGVSFLYARHGSC